MTDYYKPTTHRQKLTKIVRLFHLWLQVRKSPSSIRLQEEKAPLAVLMVVPKLDRVGGLERQAHELGHSLTREGNAVTILTDAIDSSPEKELRNSYLIIRLRNFLALSLLLTMFRRRHRYDVVHAHGVTGFTLFALRIAAFLKIPTMLKGSTRGDFSAIHSKTSLRLRMYWKWLCTADSVIAVSEELRREAVACGVPESKIRSIPNMVNTEKFSPCQPSRKATLRSVHSLDPNHPVYLYLGRLEKRKGVDVLLHAWQKIDSGVLWIVGSGQEQENLKQLAADLSLQRIQFAGHAENPQEFLHAADVFVLPSKQEGSPGALLEAMACGLPCIATSIGGITDVMEAGKHGWLVSPDSPEELASGMQAAIDPDERRRRSERNREWIEERFSSRRIAQQYATLYREIIKGKQYRSSPSLSGTANRK